MNAYTVVGPTNFQPRFLSSFESAMDSGDVAMNTGFAASFAGEYFQKNAANDPSASTISCAQRALLITASILPRWRTMPASASRRVTSRAVKRATRSKSKLLNAARKFSRFLRMVRQLNPD